MVYGLENQHILNDWKFNFFFLQKWIKLKKLVNHVLKDNLF